jgi:hypothetical protein
MKSNPRGSPRIRLISSFAMLVLVIGGALVYSVRTTSELFDRGVDDHARCTLAGSYSRQTKPAEMASALGHFAPLLEPLMKADRINNAEGEDQLVAAWECAASGRTDADIVLRRGQTLISVIIARRDDRQAFPRVLAGRVIEAAGISLNEATRAGYSVAAFESGAYLGYVVSALPVAKNTDLAARLAPVIVRYAF